MQNKTYKVALFLVSLIGLLVFQSKVVMPFIQDVASSDLFLEQSGDEQNRLSSSNIMTESAFSQCNNHVATELLSEMNFSFPIKPINAFSLGNFQYVINADIEIVPTDSAAFTRRYVCRIKYEEGSDQSGLSNSENWSINAISGLDNLD